LTYPRNKVLPFERPEGEKAPAFFCGGQP